MKLIRAVTLLATATLLTILGVSLHHTAAPADLLLSSPNTRWNLLVNTSHNAFHPWQVDPLLALLPFTTTSSAFVLLALGIAALITIDRSSECATADAIAALLAGVTGSTILFLLFGADHVVFGSIMPVPWLLAGLSWLARHQEPTPTVRAAVLLFFGSRLAHGACQLSPLLATTSLLLATTRHRLGVLEWSAVLVPCLIMAGVTPHPPMPDYPPSAHVVTDDGVAGFTRPLIGWAPPIPVVDRGVLRGYAEWATVAAMSSLLLFLLRRREGQAVVIPLLALALLLDTAAPPAFAEIGPLQTIPRIVPGTFLIPLAPIASALLVVLICAAPPVPLYALPMWVLLGGVYFLVGTRNVTDLSIPIRGAGRLHAPGNDEPARRYQSARLTVPEEAERLERFVVSPSYRILSRHGREVLGFRTYRERFRSIRRMKPTLDASNNVGDLVATIDNKPLTRWSSGGGRQTAGEWLTIAFATPRTLKGIELSTGGFGADYPRGLRLSGGERCDGPLQELAHLPEWEGPIRFTSDGHPYYGGQPEVKVYFRPTKVGCLKIEQIGRSTRFDWSVAELLVLPASESR